MRFLHAIVLTLWISNSTASPYPQNDSNGQDFGGENVRADLDWNLDDQLDFVVSQNGNDEHHTCLDDFQTGRTIKARSGMCTNLMAPPPTHNVPPRTHIAPPTEKDQTDDEKDHTEPNTDPPTKHFYKGPCEGRKWFACCTGNLVSSMTDVPGCNHCMRFSFIFVDYASANKKVFFKHRKANILTSSQTKPNLLRRRGKNKTR